MKNNQLSVASRPVQRVDGIYSCRHSPYVNILARSVCCERCPRVLRPTDLTVGQVRRLNSYLSVMSVEVNGDRNQFSVVVL